MKSKLAASISPLFYGTYMRNMRNSSSSEIIKNNFVGKLHCKVNSRAMQSAAMENDDDFSDLGPEVSKLSASDFSELGPPLSKLPVKQIKLATEKPAAFFVKKLPCKKESNGKQVSAEGKPRIKDIMSNFVALQKPRTEVSGNTLDSEVPEDNTKKVASDVAESSHSASILNVPPKVGLSELIEAVSVFGKVSSASFVTSSDGFRSCNIEFENAESRTKAISAGKIALGSQQLEVGPVDAPHLVVVRIQNINNNTTDSMIHSKCTSVGGFVGLSRTSKDAIDAFFNVKNGSHRVKLLKTLNDTVFHGNRWSANIQTKSEPSEEIKDESHRFKLGLKIREQLQELKRQVMLEKVCVEDLEMLHASILHIEEI